MGTTRSGAYINTKGSGKRASDFAVIHSIEGDFTKQLVKINGKKVTRLRLTNGGHGQRGTEEKIMLLDEMKPVLQERIRVSEETQDNWAYGIDQCWKKELELLSKNPADTSHFIKYECTDDELSWIAEVFDELAKVITDIKFWREVSKRANQITDAELLASVKVDLEYAEGNLKEEI